MSGRNAHGSRGYRSSGAPHARRSLLLGSALSLAACNSEGGLGRSLGDDLGTFSVQASESQSDCGAGALGSTPELQFDVELARADTELFWGGSSSGSVGVDLAFDLASGTRVELRRAGGADPGCAVARQDSISGVLLADGSGAVTGFTAAMRFAFAAEPEAACTERELGEVNLPNLPCSMTYALEGQRTRAPER
jgi:hypothetical protein